MQKHAAMSIDVVSLAFVVMALGIGALGGWLLAKAAAARTLQERTQQHAAAQAVQQALVGELTRQVGDSQGDLRDLRADLDAAQETATSAREDNARLRTQLSHLQHAVPQQLELLQRAEGQLKVSFDALAGSALRTSTEEFLKLAGERLGNVQKDAIGAIDQRQLALDALIAPIRQALSHVDQKLAESERERLESATRMQTLFGQLSRGQEQLRGETQNLVRALRTPSVRGQWGEVQLRRVIEIAGMLPYCDFVEQPSLLGEQGRQRPDLIVRLPGGKSLVVDAKVPLEAYLDATDAQDEPVRDRRMVDHARQVREHITKLGAKNYWESTQASPEFVVMFLPGESFFQAALQHDAELIEFGVTRRVFPASPITLIALLQVVAQGWREERLAKNAEEVQQLGQELYSRVSKMTEYLDTLRTRLDGTVKAFNDTVGSYETRVLVTARRFKALGATSGLEIEPLQAIDTVPRVLQSANLLGLPADAVSDTLSGLGETEPVGGGIDR